MSRRNRWRASLAGCWIDPVLRSWLVESGSLTARCLRSSGHFCVRLLYDGRARGLADEGLRRERALQRVREVALVCDGVPVIFAHTTLSASANGRLGRWMAGLGSRSLGSLLFRFPGFERGRIEFMRLTPDHPLGRRAAALGFAGKDLWARRSWHRLGRQTVLVTEVFLPSICRLPQ